MRHLDKLLRYQMKEFENMIIWILFLFILFSKKTKCYSLLLPIKAPGAQHISYSKHKLL